MQLLGEKLVAAGHKAPPRNPPKNGRAYQAWLTGGWDKVTQKIGPILLRDYGIDVREHWPQDGVAKIPTREPVGTELILYSIDMSGHGLADRAREIARRAGIPYIPIHLNQRAKWPEIFLQHGFPSPPPWRKATLVAVPAQPDVYEDDPMPTPTRRYADTALCKAIGKLRKTANLTQQDYAEMIGSTQPTWGSWERGDSRPFYRYFKALADLSPEILDMLPDSEPFKGRYMKDPERKQRLPQPTKPTQPITPEQRERIKVAVTEAAASVAPEAAPVVQVDEPKQPELPRVAPEASETALVFEETRGKFEALAASGLVLEEAPKSEPQPVTVAYTPAPGSFSGPAKLAESIADMGIEAIGAAYGRQMRVVEHARAVLRAEEAKASELHTRLLTAAAR